MSDPAYAIAILFPVAASVNTALGVDILAVSVIAEWFNTLLKWFVSVFIFQQLILVPDCNMITKKILPVGHVYVFTLYKFGFTFIFAWIMYKH